MNSTKIRVVPFLYKHQLTVIQSSQGTDYETFIELDIPEVGGWGPYIDAITPHVQTENRSANVRWKIVFWWSVDGKSWEGPVDLFAEIGDANGSSIRPDYTDKAKLGLKMKYGLAGRSTSVSTIETASVTVACAYSFRS